MARALATCAATALAAALLRQQWQLVVVAAPLLGALSAIAWLHRPPRGVHAGGDPQTAQCFESETVDVRITVQHSGGQAELTVRLVLAAGIELVGDEPANATSDATTTLDYRLVARRWGTYPLAVRVTAIGAGGLLRANVTLSAVEVRIYPLAPPEPATVPHPELSARLGTHLTRRHGSGVEYADIRTYVPGDPLRAINWPVSARRGQLHVTERFTDRAADVVAVIDTYPQAPGPASAALQQSVSGATQVVQAALQRGDRAGVIALGRRPRWLGPDLGRRQFYRVLDTVLDVGGTRPVHVGTLAPRPAVPPGATVVAFSTLLESDFALALIDLRRRGHVVIVLDVLRGAPFAVGLDPLTARIWRLERKKVHRDLGLSGVDVIAWPEESTLDQALSQLGPASAHRRAAHR